MHSLIAGNDYVKSLIKGINSQNIEERESEDFMKQKIKSLLNKKTSNITANVLLLSLLINLMSAMVLPAYAVSTPTVDSYINFGSTNSLPIKWRVLSVNQNMVTLYAVTSVGDQVMGQANWMDSTLRSWLNGEFYNSAFSDNEKNVIQTSSITTDVNGTSVNTTDKVYIPSTLDVCGSNSANGATVPVTFQVGSQYFRNSGMWGSTLLPYFSDNSKIWFHDTYATQKLTTYPMIQVNCSSMVLQGDGSEVSPYYVTFVPTVESISSPSSVYSESLLSLTTPTVSDNGNAITSQGWQLSSTDRTTWTDFDPGTQIFSASQNGYYIRYYATNSLGTGYSNEVTITVNKYETSLALSVNPVSPSDYPAEIELTATLSNADSLSNKAIDFYLGDTKLNTAAIMTDSNGKATYTYTSAQAASYVFSAHYAGDNKNNEASSNDLNYTINKGTQSAITIIDAPITKNFGDSNFTLTASGGAGTGDYKWSINNEKKYNGTPAVSGSIATITSGGIVTINGAGSFTINVYRQGDNNYNDSDVVTTDITVNQSISTISIIDKTVTYSKTAVNYQDSDINFKTGSTGAITFTYYSDSICTTSISAPVDAGTYYVVASIEQDENYSSATSNIAILTIVKKDIIISSVATQNKLYGTMDPKLNYTYEGNIGNETPAFIGSLSRETGDKIGDYAISLGDLSLTDNGEFKAKNYAIALDNKPAYFQIKEYTPDERANISEPNGTNGWFNSNEISLNAPLGFTISQSNALTGNSWSGSIDIDNTDGLDKTVTYYLKNNADGAISNQLTSDTYKVDCTQPKGQIVMGTNRWSQFLNKITFGIFFKETRNVTITTEDQLSETTTEYLQTETSYNGESIKNATGWVTGTSFNIMPNFAGYIYAKITSGAGLVTYIDTDGMVGYTDSQQATEEIKFTKTSTSDVTSRVILNGNTIKDITDSKKTLANSTDYTVFDDTITFKASYLNTLEAGNHTLTVIYNPQGKEFVKGTDNQEPATTTISLSVSKATGSITNISDISKIYDGKGVLEPTISKLGSGSETIEYKEKGAGDNAYTTTGPATVGNYTVRVTVGEDNNYEQASVTKDFNISYLSLPVNPYTLTPEPNTTGWRNTEVSIVPANTYTVATSLNGTYQKSIRIPDSVTNYIIYLKNSSGQMTDAITIQDIKIDREVPSGEISIDENKWNTFLNQITFGLFFKETKSVNITAKEQISGTTTEYLQSETRYNADTIKTAKGWIAGTSFNIAPKFAGYIYAKITSGSGLVSYIDTIGIVSYTDSQQATANISFSKAKGSDVMAKLKLNGNTIKQITDGTKILVNGTDYDVSGDMITFKLSYLDTLALGNYTLTISYNPQGKEYDNSQNINNKPLETQIMLQVTNELDELKKIHITPISVDFFENEKIQKNEIAYTIEGLLAGEAAENILDLSKMILLIDNNPILSNDFTLTEGIHSVSFSGAMASGYEISFETATITVHKKLTINFDANGGINVPKPVSAQSGQLLNMPQSPMKTGSAFIGWTLDKTTNKLWDFAYDTVTTDAVLYAVWSNDLYSVAIKSNNGSPDIIYTGVAKSTFINKPQDPELKGYGFVGWYSNPELTIPWNFSKNPVTKDVNIYAKFTRDTYTVNFELFGSLARQPITGIYYDTLVRPIPTVPEIEGKIFAGWYLDKNLSQSFDFAFDTVKSDITLYPRWVNKTYTVFGGVADSNGNIVPDVKVKISSNGSQLAETTTDNNGLFRFIQVPQGDYILTAISKDGKSKTLDISVVNKDIMELVMILPLTNTTTVAQKSNNARYVDIRNMDNLLNSSQKSVFTVTEQKILRSGGNVKVNSMVKSSDEMPAEKLSSVNNFASKSGLVTAESYDVSIQKLITDVNGNTQTGYISQTDNTLMIKIPLTDKAKNKNNYYIIREHNGQMQTITTTPQNGEYIELANDSIIVHAKRFSSFTVAFDSQYAPTWGWLLVVIPLLLIICLLYVKNLESQKGGDK